MKKTLNADAVRKALNESGLTQSQLAKTIGVSSQAVTNWLKGKDFPHPAKLLKLATSLKLNFDSLVLSSAEGRPVIAFRKKGNAKTTAEHLAKAEGIGMLLKPLVPYLPQLQALRRQISSPAKDYQKIQVAVQQTRKEIGIGQAAALEYEHVISEFKSNGAVLVPVMWGEKGNHENALHIRLPEEDVTFIFVNLDTRLEDFNFWMTHELAHIYTPTLTGTNEGEDYADAFAGALLFPQPCAKQAYLDASAVASTANKINVLDEHARLHLISLNTVYQQVCQFFRANALADLNIPEIEIHKARNNKKGELVSKALFDPLPPEPSRYIAACEQVFQSEFFSALKQMIVQNGTGTSYIQQILNVSLQDAAAIYKELHP